MKIFRASLLVKDEDDDGTPNDMYMLNTVVAEDEDAAKDALARAYNMPEGDIMLVNLAEIDPSKGVQVLADALYEGGVVTLEDTLNGPEGDDADSEGIPEVEFVAEGDEADHEDHMNMVFGEHEHDQASERPDTPMYDADSIQPFKLPDQDPE